MPILTGPNPIGVHALVWVGDTSPASVEYAVNKTAETGYDLLELSLHDAQNLDVADTRDRLRGAGLSVACSRGLTFDADVSSDNPDTVARGQRLLHDSLRVTHALGGTLLTGALFSALGKYARPLTKTGRDNVVGVLSDLAAEARQLGMTLGLEVCNRYETNVVNTALEAIELADEIAADNVIIHLDTYHMNIEEDGFIAPIRAVGDRLGYIHIGENHRGYLGSGHIDFDAFFVALAEIDYRGPITFESFSSAVVSPGLSSDLAIWRNLWDDGEDLARQARAFIAERLAGSRS